MALTRTIMALGICLLAGCSVLAPRPDNSRFFILTPLSGGSEPTAAAAPATPLTVGVGPIEFPDYLRRQQVVTRSAPNQIALSDENRWGEPLDRNFERVLSENLAELLDTQRIENYPWSRKTAVDYQVKIDVEHFETGADGQARLAARWIIKDGQSGKDLYSSQTSTSAAAGPGEAGASAALSDDLSTLSRDIASRLTDLSLRRNSTAAMR